MPVVITVRHRNDVSTAVQQYAQTRGEALLAAFPKTEHAHIILDRDKRAHRVEVVVQAKDHNRINAACSSERLRLAMDEAFDRIERQLRRFRDKGRKGRRRIRNRVATPQPETKEATR